MRCSPLKVGVKMLTRGLNGVVIIGDDRSSWSICRILLQSLLISVHPIFLLNVFRLSFVAENETCILISLRKNRPAEKTSMSIDSPMKASVVTPVRWTVQFEAAISFFSWRGL